MRERKGNGRTISWGERLPNSRGHGVTLFQNAARPSVAAAARIPASVHAISSFSSPVPPLTEGGESRLFFSLNSVDRPSASPPSPLGRKDSLETSITEERRLERVFVKRRTANQSSSTNVLPRRTKEKKVSTTITTTIVVHHRSFHLSFNRQRGTPPPSSVLRGVRRTIPTRKFATEKETALITYEKGNSFPPPSLSVGFSEELRSPALY